MERKEAIEIVRSNFPNGRIQLSEALETLIPELAESEDEKIRKALIENFSNMAMYPLFEWGATIRIPVSDIVTWLEKQGEQQKSSWSEEDEVGLGDALWAIEQAMTIAKDENDMSNLWYAEKWLKSLKGKCKCASEHNKIQFEKQSKLKPFDYENANIPQEDFALIEPRFREGDVITSSNNRKLKYLIKKVGVQNELGELDYVVESIADNEFKGKIYNISIDKVDSWGVLVEDSAVEDNKVEPKFKTGDYVVYLNGTYTLEDDGKHYILTAINENTSTPIVHVSYGNGEYTLEKWDITNAKDGDVLCQDSTPFIFKCWANNCIAYCGITSFGLFKVVEDYFSWCNGFNVTPATKEQRNLLFTKMQEAGYIWNEKELKLEKI